MNPLRRLPALALGLLAFSATPVNAGKTVCVVSMDDHTYSVYCIDGSCRVVRDDGYTFYARNFCD